MAGLADTAPRPEPVVFREAIDFLRAKLRLPTRAWTDLWGEQHARGFAVAGATRDALLADFQAALLRALEQGTGLAEFQADFDAIVARHGWSYRGGRAWRARTIFQANLRSAHMAGRWRQIQRTAARRPYLRYVQVQRPTKRDDHAQWHGLILPIADPFWRTHFPPNGWYCLCSVQTVSERELRRRGWTVAAEAPAVNLRPVTLNTPDGPATVQVPEGIDPGWGHNAGLAAYGYGDQRRRLAGHEGRWVPMLAPSQVARGAAGPLTPVAPRARLGPDAPSESAQELRARLSAALGGEEAVFADPAGGQVAIGPALADHIAEEPHRRGRARFFPLIPELVEDPEEIWVGFALDPASGLVSLRRRYVKMVQLGRRTALALVADADQGSFSGFTFYQGTGTQHANLRWGLPVYRRDRAR